MMSTCYVLTILPATSLPPRPYNFFNLINFYSQQLSEITYNFLVPASNSHLNGKLSPTQAMKTNDLPNESLHFCHRLVNLLRIAYVLYFVPICRLALRRRLREFVAQNALAVSCVAFSQHLSQRLRLRFCNVNYIFFVFTLLNCMTFKMIHCLCIG